MTAAMMSGFSSEFVEIEKNAGIGKWLAGAALAGTLGTAGVKAAPKMMGRAAPAITHAMPKPIKPMGMTAGQMADKDVASALSFR